MDFNSVKGKVAIVTGAKPASAPRHCRVLRRKWDEGGLCSPQRRARGRLWQTASAPRAAMPFFSDRLQQGFCHQGTGGQDGGTLR